MKYSVIRSNEEKTHLRFGSYETHARRSASRSLLFLLLSASPRRALRHRHRQPFHFRLRFHVHHAYVVLYSDLDFVCDHFHSLQTPSDLHCCWHCCWCWCWCCCCWSGTISETLHHFLKLCYLDLLRFADCSLDSRQANVMLSNNNHIKIALNYISIQSYNRTKQ